MSDLTIDRETLETGDKISIFLIASDLKSLTKKSDNIPLHPGEELIEIEGNYFRRALIIGAVDSNDNGMVFIPWDVTPIHNINL